MCNAIKNALYKRFNIRSNKRAANNINNIYKLILIALYYIFYKKRKMSMATEKTDISLGPEAKSSHMKLPDNEPLENLGLL